MKNNYPFYVLKPNSVLFLDNPAQKSLAAGRLIKLDFGDILFPVKINFSVKGFFYVRTIHNQFGWINSQSGISIDYSEDQNLYYFSKGKDHYRRQDYYLQKYINLKGAVNNSDKIVLLKNIIPLLLGHYQTDGWFYPQDDYLALELSKYAVNIAQHKKTFFYAATMYDRWSPNEFVVAMNLLADSYHKLCFYGEAEKIHKLLLRRYFGEASDNTRLGGINSVVKLVKIYLDQLKNEEKESPDYLLITNKVVNTTLILGDTYNTLTIMDKKWHLTAAEWILDILRKSVDRQEFYHFCDLIMNKTASEGYSDMVKLHKTLEMYREGKKTEAMQILTTIKPKKNFKATLRINDWLTENHIIPDSIAYQYNF